MTLKIISVNKQHASDNPQVIAIDMPKQKT